MIMEGLGIGKVRLMIKISLYHATSIVEPGTGSNGGQNGNYNNNNSNTNKVEVDHNPNKSCIP
jgi:hypothetical protein